MSALKTDVHVLAPHRSNSVVVERRATDLPPRRPTSARASIVQQKLQSALSQAEKTAELAAVESQTSFRCSKRFADAADDTQCDRSVSRYRSDAAIVSCADPASPFAYSANFLPGAHFYTFLASKDTATNAVARAAQLGSIQDTGNAGVAGVASTGAAAATATADTLPDPDESSKPTSSLASTRKKTSLRMWIPDTVVYGETGRAVWLSTDKDGFVQRCTDFSERQVLEKLGNPTTCDVIDRPVVVYKESVVSTRKRSSHTSAAKHKASSSSDRSVVFASGGNQLRLLNPGELKTLLSHVANSKKCFALQQFVKCNGSKAFVVRAVHDAGKPAYAWMISNVVPFQDANEQSSASGSVGNGGVPSTPLSSARGPPSTAATTSVSDPSAPSDASSSAAPLPTESTSAASVAAVVPLVNRLCTSVQLDKTCTFVKLNERGCATVSELNQRLVKYIEHKLHVQLQSLVADYVKDATGRWWLLQVKAFRVRSRAHPERVCSLPLKLRVQYLSYRDSSILEDNSESDDDDHNSGDHSSSNYAQRGQSMAALAQRQVRKLVQCKCCLASYPKAELSFKMTLKMISETLVRIRARLPPDKTYAFLTAALSACEAPDASLAYESWSVCSFCYAIYERDQQLKRIETKFSTILGLPNAATAADGLSVVQDRTPFALDPNSLGSVLPPQLTLCRLVLVFNAIYDIPKELVDAEQHHFGVASLPIGANKTKTLRAIASKLYLRVTALGYTECIPLCADDIEIAPTRAPRGASLRRSSSVESDLDADNESAVGEPETTTRPRDRLDSSATTPATYWLPISIIRTIHFAAPRTPLQSKVKDTSGIASLLNDETNILVQLIRATEPPLKDPAAVKRRTKKRRAALIPDAASVSEMVSEMQQLHHAVLLGSTTIRMAQFRSAYVTKIDFYACMALSGEMFNLKGNIGLERLRYVDTKLLTSQYRLRLFHGVFIPDDSYLTSDPLSSEWMDALLVSFHKQARGAVQASGDDDDNGDDDDAIDGRAPGGSPKRHARMQRLARSTKYKQQQSKQSHSALGRASNQQTRSTTSLSSADNGEMDEELEAMIDRANADLTQKQQTASLRAKTLTLSPREQDRTLQQRRHPETHDLSQNGDGDALATDSAPERESHGSPPSQAPITDAAPSIATRKHDLLPSTALPSRYDRQVVMLLKKTVLSPRSALVDDAVAVAPGTLSARGAAASLSSSPLSPRNSRRLWCLLLQLHEAHNLQSREHAFCRWECHYTLFGQKRSAVERPVATPKSTHVHFTCTHTFFVAGTARMLESFVRAHAPLVLHLRNDMYASTRARSQGEFACDVSLAPLLERPSVDTTVDIRLADAADAARLTPREAAAVARASPYLSLALHLTQLALDPDDAVASGDFVELSKTPEGLDVLRKIA